MSRSVRVWVKKQLRLDLLTGRQQQMFHLGNVAVAAVKNRVRAALGPNDTPAKPLTKRYAISKSRMRAGNKRNLTLTGAMLSNFQVRRVKDGQAIAENTTRSGRIKARANQKIEEWITMSPRDQQAVVAAAKRLFAGDVKRMVKLG